MNTDQNTISKLKLGGGVVPLKQFLPTKLVQNSNSFVLNGLNINLSASNYFYDNKTSAIISGSINGACNGFDHLWSAGYNKNFPHSYQVDFGQELYIKKVCFNPSSFETTCMLKNYNIEYSIDGENFNKIYETNKTFDPSKGIIDIIKYNPINSYFDTSINQFNIIKARYIRIIIYDSYYTPQPYTGFCNLRIYGIEDFKVVFLKESDNYIYDNLSEKLIAFEEWEKLDKQEKLNLVKTSNIEEEIEIEKLKSFGNFKIIVVSE